mmetsp:Transcript_4285/g.9542  ORF Transcript_4285/g.9542 Transcript_4285/m.9542 type:complete len:98 (-) Transcript_4285:2330-2623(-)
MNMSLPLPTILGDYCIIKDGPLWFTLHKNENSYSCTSSTPSTTALSGSRFMMRQPPNSTSGISSSDRASIVKPTLKIKSGNFGDRAWSPFRAKKAHM